MLSPFRLILCFVPIVILVCLIVSQLSTDLIPPEKTAALTVSFALPNSSPDVVEQQVTSILEGAFSQLRDVKKISSFSDYNAGSIKLHFDSNTDMQMKRLELSALIRQLYTQLPAATTYPVINGGDHVGTAWQPPMLSYSINAALQPFRIKQVAEAVFQKSFADVAGVKEVKISGTENFTVCIYFNKNRCDALHINVGRISTMIQDYYSTSYPGHLTDNGEQYFLKVSAGEPSVTSLGNMVLPVNGSGAIHLHDIASIYLEEQAPSSYFRINGKNSVTLNIYAHAKENKLLLGKIAKQIIARASHQLPPGYEIILAHDDTAFLQKEIDKNYRRITLSVIILLILISLTYRRLRYTVNLFATLLATVCLTLLFIWWLHVDIHLYTLAGLAISFGIVTDNTIVVLDHYHRNRNRKIFTALLGANLITISALCLIFFLPPEERNNLIDFSIVIILALVASLMATLWVTPALYKLLFHDSPASGKSPPGRQAFLSVYYSMINRIAMYRKTFLLVLILSFGVPVFLLPAKWEGTRWYHTWYNKVFDNDHFKENIRPSIDTWTGGMLYVFARKVFNNSGYRSPEETKLLVQAELPYGNTIEQMNAILSDFERSLSAVKGIDKYVTAVYSGQRGSIEISFRENEATAYLPHQLKSWLINRSSDWGGVTWKIQGVGKGFSNQAEGMPGYMVKMKGYNYDELGRQADLLAEKLQQNKRVHHVNTNERTDIADKQSAEYVIQLDKTGMALYNTSKSAILTRLYEISKPVETAGSVVIDNKLYPVIIKEAKATQFTSYDLLHGYTQTDSGKVVRISDFGKMALEPVNSRIQKEDRQYIRMVSFSYMGSDHFGRQFLERTVKEMQLQLPVGYTAAYETGGWDWSTDQLKYTLIGLLVLCIYIICSMLFESLTTSLSIITIIPVSFIGVFITFAAGDLYLDQGGYAAFVMLSGLVTNAGIFIVTDYKNLIKQHSAGVPKNMLLMKAIVNRSGTILLTTLSTCCGLMPFVMEGNDEIFWFSLSVGTIGGLLFSMLAIFVVLPVLLWEVQILSRTSAFKNRKENPPSNS